MRRRNFIKGIACSIPAWPIAAQAQPANRIPLIAVIMPLSEDDSEGQTRVAAFRQELQNLGWIVGHNVRIEYRWGAGDPNRARRDIAELLAHSPDIVLAAGSQTLEPLLQATHTVPIVFVQVADPVGVGFIPTLSHPGGNITGFTHYEFALAGKWLELLKEIDPRLVHVGIVDDRDDAATAGYLAKIRSAAPALGVQVTAMQARNGDDIERGINTLAAERNSGLLVLPSALTAAQRDLIVALAGWHKLPAVYPYRYFIPGGGLLSYGIEVNDLYRKAAGYIDRILAG